MEKVAVIGLGRFGTALARRLGVSRVQVIAVDRSPQLVSAIQDDVEVAVRLDTTDEQALRSQELEKVDVCVIAIGENFEAALLTTVLMKKLGVKKIICRAQTEFHAQIFLQIGADEVIQPETQAGEHLARRLANPHLRDVIVLADGFALIEIQAPAAMCGKTLKQLLLRAKYDVNLVAIKRPVPVDPSATEGSEAVGKREEIISVPQADDVIQPEDILVVVGSDQALSRLPKE